MGAWKECRVCGEPLCRSGNLIFCGKGCFELRVQPEPEPKFDVTDPDNFPTTVKDVE